jgi:hypothetical protein
VAVATASETTELVRNSDGQTFAASTLRERLRVLKNPSEARSRPSIGRLRGPERPEFGRLRLP